MQIVDKTMQNITKCHIPIPFVPPVTNAFFDCNPQKLGGGGAGTEYSLLAVEDSHNMNATRISIDERRKVCAEEEEDGNIIMPIVRNHSRI